jgi:transcription-repair coupling factor (superfamily II helicase)
MIKFIENKSHILVCTTIIESGLDMPNVNTLIVNNADNFGLAQLYQLRGRVGRSRRQAFAYFTYSRNAIISETAKKRLVAIGDFTELGAGFKIAMRDMEIRGAGDVLGTQQHGNIAAVGFDLYCRLLQEEMNSQSGLPPQVRPSNAVLELNMDAYIPDSCIDDSVLKVEIYKRIAGANEIDKIDALKQELEDRYGKLPLPVKNLLLLGKIKVYTGLLGISSVNYKHGCFEICPAAETRLNGESLLNAAKKWEGKFTFRGGKKASINLYLNDALSDNNSQARVKKLIKFFESALNVHKNNCQRLNEMI